MDTAYFTWSISGCGGGSGVGEDECMDMAYFTCSMLGCGGGVEWERGNKDMFPLHLLHGWPWAVKVGQSLASFLLEE